MSDKKEEAKPEAAAGAPAAPAGGGGIKSWLPLLVTILLMPALAFVTTKFLIVPKVLHARGGEAETEETTEEGGDAHGAKPEAKHGEEKADKGHGEAKKPEKAEKAEHGEKGKGGGKGKKQTAQLSKMIVNVAGTSGTRYLMSSITIVGTHADLKGLIEENKDQLLDLANSALASKTISDLEKPGSRNQLRSELMSTFNNALGGNIVQEIYFTEFAIQ